MQTVADEVIVDSDSTDSTRNCRITRRTRVPKALHHVCRPKNRAASPATQPYILSLDADEALGEALLADIEDWKSRPRHANAAWSMLALPIIAGLIRHEDGTGPQSPPLV